LTSLFGCCSTVTVTEKWIAGSPEGAPGWRDVWSEDRRYRGGSSLVRWVGSFLERFRHAEIDRQRDFNLAVLDLVRDLSGQLESLHSDVRQLHLDLVHSSEAITGRLERELPIAVYRNDALLAAVDRKVETLAVRTRDLSTKMLTGVPASFRDDFIYRRMEDSLRGSEDETRGSLSTWIDLIAANQPLIDVGCGRGELLVLCRERGIVARGLDTNERSVADLRARGIDVTLGAIPAALLGIEAESLGSIVASHVVEHLPAGTLIDLMSEARRILRPGGLLLIETPNAESLSMSANDFWRDPTHISPRHPASLVLLGREFGFGVARISTTSPYPPDRLLQVDGSSAEDLKKVVARLNGILFADQNLRLVLRKE
jgi:SAM-dependent methyltransferase